MATQANPSAGMIRLDNNESLTAMSGPDSMGVLLDDALIELELDVLIDAVRRRSGYDFRNYSRNMVRRRVLKRMQNSGLETISEMVPLVLRDESFHLQLVRDMSVTVTELFRNPSFFRAFREHVVPKLRTYPFFKIWHAGCATGEEAYSMAILLREEGLSERAQVYATDFNKDSLVTARVGLYAVDDFQQWEASYQAGGGTRSLADYCDVNASHLRFHGDLRGSITFASHNLVSDYSFGEMNVILCRNVLIYFDQTLKDSILAKFGESLCHGGFLCLGKKENLRCSSVQANFSGAVPLEQIYQSKS